MRMHWLQHVPFEGLEFIQAWAHENRFLCTRTAFYNEEWQLPDEDEVDWLVIMGGPMGIHQEDLYPWLVQEKQFVKSCIEKGKKVLGVCLGAQLIADVMGASVGINREVEIGWHKVKLSDEGVRSPLLKGFPGVFRAFHWHGDTFEIPDGAVRLMESAGCDNQAFSIEDRVVGLQFHLESSVDGVEMLLQNCSDEIRPGKYVQSAAVMRSMLSGIPEINDKARLLLDNMSE